MKEILKEIKHCRERNLILFGELKEKLGIDEKYFVKDIEEVKELALRRGEDGKQALNLDGEKLEVHSEIEEDGTHYVAVKTQGRSEGEIDYNLIYSKNVK